MALPQQPDGERPTPADPQQVHLPALMSDEFGMSRSEARMLIAAGTVSIDDAPVTGLDFQRDELVGRVITVRSVRPGVSGVRFRYRP